VARPTKVAFIALGCAKNLVDSEKMLGQIAEAGAVLTSDEADADVIVINTCGFLGASREEAHEAIAEAVARKRTGRCRRVVVAGCLVQRDGEKLLEVFPQIDALVGVNNRDDVAAAALTLPVRKGKPARSKPDLFLGDYHPHAMIDTARLRLTPQHYAYLRISEGCNQKCTFCTIPAIRGPLHSKPPEIVLAEARELIADGAVELNLIGQDTTSYGADIGYAPGLAGLMREMNRLPGARWLRLMYAYPTVFTDEMIAALAECERFVKYVDIPLQHISDRVLKMMARRVTRAETEKLLAKLRKRVPGIAIRTTLIAGFPGETEAEHEELRTFIHDFSFDALGVFPYSHEPDTPAGRLKGHLPDSVRNERTEELMAVQQKVAFARARRQIGRVLEVLIETPPDETGRQQGRHAGQAPEVDAVTYVQSPAPPAAETGKPGRKKASRQKATPVAAKPGDLIRAECIDTVDYDLLACPLDGTLRSRHED